MVTIILLNILHKKSVYTKLKDLTCTLSSECLEMHNMMLYLTEILHGLLVISEYTSYLSHFCLDCSD